jgi:hypothetical protein
MWSPFSSISRQSHDFLRRPVTSLAGIICKTPQITPESALIAVTGLLRRRVNIKWLR